MVKILECNINFSQYLLTFCSQPEQEEGIEEKSPLIVIEDYRPHWFRNKKRKSGLVDKKGQKKLLTPASKYPRETEKTDDVLDDLEEIPREQWWTIMTDEEKRAFLDRELEEYYSKSDEGWDFSLEI
jgi:hypothetical protein